VGSARTLEGLIIDPIVGPFPGALVVVEGRIAAVERDDDLAGTPVVFPGFIDLHVYDSAGIEETGVTGYLLATRDPNTPVEGLCLGLHLEGPFLNSEAAGAIPVDELQPVDLPLLGEWLAGGHVRLVTVSPEIPGGLDAIALVAEKAVAAVGHTRANVATVRAALDAGARFATHLWNAMAPLAGRTTGPIVELLLDERVTLGLIVDGRHLHPRVEELTVRVAGPERIALTSDLVANPAQRPDGILLGGDRAGAALIARMARFGLREAALMASLVPARLLGLADRGRIAPGFRADLAVLDESFTPLETIGAGETLWDVSYPQSQKLDDRPPSTHAPEDGA
jgi:N-acetylglucosamine-6-phosphate deacetylase